MRHRRPMLPSLFTLVLSGAFAVACSRPAANIDDGGLGGVSGGGGTIRTDGGLGGQELILDDGGAPTPGGATVTAGTCPAGTFLERMLAGPYVPGDEQSQAATQIAAMSIAEKASQMRGGPSSDKWNRAFETQYTNNAGIQQTKFRDGPRGVNMLCEKKGSSGYSTAFPVAMARGASWDMELEERVGEAMGDETVASGNTMLLAPVVEVLRHPAWGRAQETYGEDPFALAKMGAAYVSGVQKYVPACAKHYAANNIEKQRSSANAQMDEQTLREIYTRPYGMLIKESGVACVMAAYNLINGTKCTQNSHLLKEILRSDWGFDYGVTLTDWEAMPTGSAQTIAQDALNATLDIEMPHSVNYAQLESIAATGNNTQLISESAQRILQQKYRFNQVAPGSYGKQAATTTLNKTTWSIENNGEHIALAEESALKSIVLLKNSNDTLPIKSGAKKIAVVGADVPYTCQNTDFATGTVKFATDVRLGDLGSSRVASDPAKSVGPCDGLKQAAANAGSGITVNCGNSATTVSDDTDFVVVVAGLTPQDEGEEYTNGVGDRASLGLVAKHTDLIAAVAQKGKPFVVVLEAGSVIDMSSWLDSAPAVVMAWYPGMVGGRALGKLLFGQENFSGKLPISWAASADAPPFPFTSGTTTAMEYFAGYRYYENAGKTPVFPLGHGLTYSTVQYGNLQVPCDTSASDGLISVTVDVANTSDRAVDEVIFLFTQYPSGSARNQVKQLKAFYRVGLAAAGELGATKRITLPLRVSDLQYWDSTAGKWALEKGTLKIMVGPSSTNLPLFANVTLN